MCWVSRARASTRASASVPRWPLVLAGSRHQRLRDKSRLDAPSSARRAFLSASLSRLAARQFVSHEAIRVENSDAEKNELERWWSNGEVEFSADDVTAAAAADAANATATTPTPAAGSVGILSELPEGIGDTTGGSGDPPAADGAADGSAPPLSLSAAAAAESVINGDATGAREGDDDDKPFSPVEVRALNREMCEFAADIAKLPQRELLPYTSTLVWLLARSHRNRRQARRGDRLLLLLFQVCPAGVEKRGWAH